MRQSSAAAAGGACFPASTPAAFAAALRRQGLQQAPHLGRPSGHWVFDDTIIELLLFISSSQHLTFNRESFEVLCCYLENSTGSVQIPDEERTDLPDCNWLMLVTHTASETQGYHFSAIILNATHKTVHAFDTLRRWQGRCVAHAHAPQTVCILHKYTRFPEM